MVTAVKAAEEPPAAALSSLALAPGEKAEAEAEEEEEEDLVEALRAFAAGHGAGETAAHLRQLKTQNVEHRMHTLLFASLSGEAEAPPLSKQLGKAAPLFALAAPDAPARAALLASLELWLAGREEEAGGIAAAAKGLAAGLHALYDADALDEPAILAWFDNAAAGRKFGVPPAAAAAVRKAAAAFVEWLKNAESDSDESE